MFPSSQLEHLGYPSLPDPDPNVFYLNYHGAFTLTQSIPEDDYGYQYVAGKGYRLVKNQRELCLFNIGPPHLFMGVGFSAISAHAVFGIQRRPEDLLRIHSRTKATGVKTSGHMIASIFAHDAHFAWYLEELVANHFTKRSVYLIPSLDRGDGVYHSLAEYRHAVLDLMVEKSKYGLPKYASRRPEYLNRFLDHLGR
jgi:hypothetical protein